MKNWKPLGRRGLALILALIMCLSLTNLTVLAAGAQEAPPKGYETHSTPTVEQSADVSTAGNYASVVNGNPNTPGIVWTDKSVTPVGSEKLQVTFSALSSAQQEIATESTPVDVMLVLDMSGTMAKTDGKDHTRLYYMVEAINEFLDNLVNHGSDKNTRVGIVTYHYAAQALVPIGHYDQVRLEVGNNGEYKESAVTATRRIGNSEWTTHEATTTGTNTQAGMYMALAQQLGGSVAANKDKNAYVILLSDGAASHSNGVWGNNLGDGQITPAEGISGLPVYSNILHNFSGMTGNDPWWTGSIQNGQGTLTTGEYDRGIYGGKTGQAGSTTSVTDVISVMKALLTTNYYKEVLNAPSNYNGKLKIYTVGVGFGSMSTSPAYGNDRPDFYYLTNFNNRNSTMWCPSEKELAQVTLNPSEYLLWSSFSSVPANHDADVAGGLVGMSNEAAYRIQIAWNHYVRTARGTAQGNTTMYSPWGMQYVVNHPNGPAIGGGSYNGQEITTLDYVDEFHQVDNVESISNIFNDLYSQAIKNADPVITDALVYTDPIGENMVVTNVDALVYNGRTYTVTGNHDGIYTAAGTVQSGTGPVDLSTIQIAVKNGEVTVTVPANALPASIVTKKNDNGTVTSSMTTARQPLQVVYTVAKSGSSQVKDDEDRQLYYSNQFDPNNTGKGLATVAFTPADDNPYYANNGVNPEVQKSSNTTGTAGTVSVTEWKDGSVVTYLGNNGKLTVGKTYTVDLYLNKTAYGSPLGGATFMLTHAGTCKGCEANIANMTVTSRNSDGLVEFKGVPSGHTYTVTETKAPDGYGVSGTSLTFKVEKGKVYVDGKEYTARATVENKLDPNVVPVTITKNWQNDVAGTRPTSLKVTLEASVDGARTQNYDQTVTLNPGTGNVWTATKQLPSIDPETGKEISYTVKESVPASYQWNEQDSNIIVQWARSNGKIVSGSAELNNKLDSVELTISKVWLAPESFTKPEVTAVVYANGTEVRRVTLSGNNWSTTVSNLPVRDANGDINYTVTEATGANSTVTGDGHSYTFAGVTSEGTAWTITNKIVQETFTINGRKQWNGPVPTEDVTVTLTGKVGSEVVYTAEAKLTGDNKDAFIFNSVPKYDVGLDGRTDTGKEIQYTVSDHVGEVTIKEVTVTYPETTADVPSAIGKDNVSVTLTNTRSDIDEKIDITATKVWDDNGNAYGTRPTDGVTLTLQKQLADGSWDTVKTAQAGNGAKTVTVEVQPEPTPTPEVGEPPVEPTPEPDPDPTPTPDPDPAPTPDPEPAPDGSDEPAPAPDPVPGDAAEPAPVPGGSSDEPAPAPESQPDEPEELPTLSGSVGDDEPQTVTKVVYEDRVTVEFTNLPKYDGDGNEITYRVVELELDVPAKYTATIGTAENDYEVTNTLNGGERDISVTKVWKSPADTRQQVTVTLTPYVGNEEIKGVDGIAPVTLTFDGAEDTQNQTATVRSYYNGAEIDWRASESPVLTDYKAPAITGDMVNGFTVTNEIAPVDREVTVTKVWAVPAGFEEAHYPSITITLSRAANGVKDESFSRELTNASGWTKDETTGNWTYTWQNLPTYNADGQRWTYTVSESMPNPGGFTSAVDGLTVTNTFNAGTVSITGEKRWVIPDGGTPTDAQIEAVQISVYRSTDTERANPIASTGIQLVEDKYTYSFDNLPQYDSATGEAITYVVAESAVPAGFTSAVGADGTTITNTSEEIGKKITISVSKSWVGPTEGRPESLDVVITGTVNGTQVSTTPLTLYAASQDVPEGARVGGEGGGWSGSVTLPKYDGSNNTITYTVSEVGEADGKITLNDVEYTVTYTSQGSTAVAITNTVVQEYVDVSGSKIWAGEIPDDFTPPAIRVQLYADFQPVEGQIVTLNPDRPEQPENPDPSASPEPGAGDPWAYRWANLPKYALEGNGIVKATNGHAIQYSVVEVDATGNRISFEQNGRDYLFEVSGGTEEHGLYNLTNTYTETQRYYYEVACYYVTHYTNGDKDTVAGPVVRLPQQEGAKNALVTAGDYGVQFREYDGAEYTYDGDHKGNVTSVTLERPNETYRLVLYFEREEDNTTPVVPTPTPTPDPTPTPTPDPGPGPDDPDPDPTPTPTPRPTPEPEEPPVDIPDPDVPLVDVPDEDVPLVDVPDEDIPLAPVPEELVEVPEEEVPLADVPQTGDGSKSAVWLLASVASGLSLFWMFLTRKKPEEEG